MSLTLNTAEARKADNFSSVIKDSGKYVGVITRAEKLVSKNGVQGLGLSFKTDDGASANYLDIYMVKPDGEKLFGFNTVQALLCCLRLKNADEGEIRFERWNKEERRMAPTTAPGYPAMMGKRIGFVLQKEIQTHSMTGADTERLNIVGVFEAATGLTSSEILDGKTKAEKIDIIAKMVAANPVRDTRKRQSTAKAQVVEPQQSAAYADFDDEIPF